jgi:fatty-acid peroxygenase
VKRYQNLTVASLNAAEAAYHLFNDGFTFIMNRRRLMNTDVFTIDVPGLKVICIGGEEAAGVFYDPEKFVRKGAIPVPVQKTLTGLDAIHTTDASQHSHRKALFMSFMTEDNVARLQQLIRHELEVASISWSKRDRTVLFEESGIILCEAICAWAGVPLAVNDSPLRAKQFIAMVDAFGTMGARHFKGVKARKQVEAWITELIEKLRTGQLNVDPNSPLYHCAHFKEVDGSELSAKLAAVELINILRPTVAIAWYITFAATALFSNDSYKEQFISGAEAYQENFINEVRRFFPFAPFMGAKVRESFVWKGVELSKGNLVLLDMYGTNHDDRLWDNPFAFIPERFGGRQIKPYDFLAQGGGYPETGHRCPGELITVETLKTVLHFLATQIEFAIPKQDMSYPFSRMPTRPRDGFIMENIKPVEKQQ